MNEEINHGGTEAQRREASALDPWAEVRVRVPDPADYVGEGFPFPLTIEPYTPAERAEYERIQAMVLPRMREICDRQLSEMTGSSVNKEGRNEGKEFLFSEFPYGEF